MNLQIRRATPDDAAGIAEVLDGIVAEGGHTALDRTVSVAEERTWLQARGRRAVTHVALVGGVIRGFQGLDPASPFASMAHVAQLGSYVARRWRGQGLAGALWQATRAAALELGFRKVSIQVQAGNHGALGYYRHLGFRDIGLARQHVCVQGRYEDEALLKLHL